MIMFYLKVDLIILEPHHVKLMFLTSSIVQLLDFLTFGIFGHKLSSQNKVKPNTFSFLSGH